MLAINPIYEHHEDIPIRLEILKKFVTGETPGAILITEPERGSDAVHMLTTCDEQSDGSFLLNGEKIYNTNAPKAGYVVAYATAEKNNGNTMAQFLIDTSWDGWNCERIYIPYVPKVWSKSKGYTSRLLEAVLGINDDQAIHIVDMAEQLAGKLAGRKVALLGLAFKPGTDDMREAASIRVVNELRKRGITDIIGYDPKSNKTAEVEMGDKIKYAQSIEEALKDSECAILITEWDEFKKLTPDDFKKQMKTP
ncbi:unnamed protein product, partial [marine sediment metagenome]